MEKQSEESKSNSNKSHICSCIRFIGPIGNPNDYGYHKEFDVDETDKDYIRLLEIERPERYIPGEICLVGEYNDIKEKGYVNRLLEIGYSNKKINKNELPCECNTNKLQDFTSVCKLKHSKNLDIDGIKCVKNPQHECLCPHLHQPKPLESVTYKIRNEILQLPNRIKLEKEQPPPFWWKTKSTDCLRPMGNANDYSFLRPSYVENELSKPINFKEIFQIDKPTRYVPGNLSGQMPNENQLTIHNEKELKNNNEILTQEQSKLENLNNNSCQDKVCSLCQCLKFNESERCESHPNMICFCSKKKKLDKDEECKKYLYHPRKHNFILKHFPKNYIQEETLIPSFMPKPKAFPNSQAKYLKFY